jgi:hypothetical protein
MSISKSASRRLLSTIKNVLYKQLGLRQLQETSMPMDCTTYELFQDGLDSHSGG